MRREDAYDQEKWREQVKAKISNPSQPRYCIKTDIVVIVVVIVVVVVVVRYCRNKMIKIIQVR